MCLLTTEPLTIIHCFFSLYTLLNTDSEPKSEQFGGATGKKRMCGSADVAIGNAVIKL